MRPRWLAVWCLIVMGMAACQSIQPSAAPPVPPVPTAAAPAALASPSAGPLPSEVATTASSKNLVLFSGDADAVSDTFTLSTAADIRVAWQYRGHRHFAIWLVNVSAEVDDPAYDRLLVADVPDENAGQAVRHLIAGDYHVEIEEAYGPWTVTVGAQP